MSNWIIKPLLWVIIKVRWGYFHISPGYQKFYVDADSTEAHFFHARTNSIHSNLTLS